MQISDSLIPTIVISPIVNIVRIILAKVVLELPYYTMGSKRQTSDLLKHPRSAGLGGPCVSLMIGCPGGGNEIRLKTTPDATTDCMPPTSLRLRLILILIHHHPHQSKSQVLSNAPSPEKLKQIYKVTNQEITTTISHSRMFCSKSDYIAQQIKSIFFVCVLCV